MNKKIWSLLVELNKEAEKIMRDTKTTNDEKIEMLQDTQDELLQTSSTVGLKKHLVTAAKMADRNAVEFIKELEEEE